MPGSWNCNTKTTVSRPLKRWSLRKLKIKKLKV
jgi:hypothetical protein